MARGGLLFVMNFTGRAVRASLPEGVDVLTGRRTGGETELPVNGVLAIRPGR